MHAPLAQGVGVVGNHFGDRSRHVCELDSRPILNALLVDVDNAAMRDAAFHNNNLGVQGETKLVKGFKDEREAAEDLNASTADLCNLYRLGHQDFGGERAKDDDTLSRAPVVSRTHGLRPGEIVQ